MRAVRWVAVGGLGTYLMLSGIFGILTKAQ